MESSLVVDAHDLESCLYRQVKYYQMLADLNSESYLAPCYVQEYHK